MASEMPNESLLWRRLRQLRDETGDARLVAVVRIVLGLLLVNEAWLATQHLGAAGARLLPAANDSFVHAMHVTSSVSTAIAVLGAVFVVIWMPGRRAAAARARPGGPDAIPAARPDASQVRSPV